MNLIEILVIILCIVWFFNKNSKYQIPDTRYNIPVALIIIGLVLSILANKNYYVGLGALKGWFVLPILFAVIFFDSLKKNEKLLKWSLAAIFFGGMLVAIEGIYYWFFGLLTYDGRLRIFYDSPNQLAMFLSLVLLVALFLFINEEKKLEKTTYGIGAVLLGINLYFTYSYGAWLAAGVATAIYLWLVYAKLMRKWTAVFLLIFIIVFLAWGTSIKLKNIESEGTRSSLASREMIWKSAGLMVKNNPVFGIGPGNFQNTYLEYQKYFPPYLEWAVPQPHNLYLAFWLEAGLLGIIGFIWLIGLFFRDNKKVYPFTKTGGGHAALVYETKKQTQESLSKENNFGDGARGLYGVICFAIMLYFLIHGLVDTTYWRNDMAILFWVVIAINLFLAREETKNQIGHTTPFARSESLPKTKNTD
ncbi:MAG: O-antigen ligase family protein [Patescibacteria group bacterium]|nr:O-antigen ligase family protein [Patescibacteria group bacterium]